ncbi:hypothetical protein LCGC14_2708020, partial [marine sediment metagenome]
MTEIYQSQLTPESDTKKQFLETEFQLLQRAIPAKETSTATHNIHSYPAKFIPHFPRLMIKHYTNGGDFVLDPMCGSGTTMIEASLLGRYSTGIDLDPISYLISKVATTPIEDNRIEFLTNKFVGSLKEKMKPNAVKKIDLPTDEEFPNASPFWFRPEVMRELIFIRDQMDEIEDSELRDVAKLSLSNIARDVSNADPRDIFPQRDKDLLVRERKDVYLEFVRSLKRVTTKIRKFTLGVENKNLAEVILGDSRKIEKESDTFDLVCTSPPYAYAMDYPRV